MAAAKCPETAWHTATPRQEIPESLRKATYVFVRHGARRTPLARPYDGPYRVLEKGEKFFRVKVGAKEQVVTVDRLKPALGFADPAPQLLGGEKAVKAAAPRKKIKKSPNPEAESFIRGRKPKESVITGRKAKEETPTTSRSKFGRTRRSPERLGIKNNL